MAQESPQEPQQTTAERRGASRRESDKTERESYLRAIERSGNLSRLVEITAQMNSTVVLDDLLARIMIASKRVANAEAGSLYLLDSAGQDLVPYIIEGGVGGELKELPHLKIGNGIAGWVAQSGKPELIEDAYQHPNFDSEYDRKTGYRTKSMICVPIVSGTSVIGVSQVINRADGGIFGQEDLELLQAFAAQAAIAIENARMHETLLTQQRLEQDLLFAKTIQQSFLPQQPPGLPDYSFASKYKSAQQVGGDFYDYIEFPDNRVGILVGDVSGKGVPAALYMARLMSDFRVIALSEHIPTRVVSKVNDLLVSRSRRGMFVTLVYILLETREQRATIINAGHLPPMLRSGTDSSVTVLDSAVGTPLGILPGSDYRAQCIPLHRGDSILAYTDGVMEARNGEGEEFGLDRMSETVRQTQGDATDIVHTMEQELMKHTDRAPSHDDLTMLCVRACQ